MNKYKRLINNSLIFTVGNFSSKLLLFFLVPVYTYYLSVKEFGTVDLLTSTISLLLPVFTLSVSQAVLRFVMEKSIDKGEVLVNSIFVVLNGNLLLLFLNPFLMYFFPFDDFLFQFYIIFFLQSFYLLFLEYIRAIGKIRFYTLTSVLYAFNLIVCNFIFLILLNLNILGYLYSIIISYSICVILMLIFGEILQEIDVYKIKINTLKSIIYFCIPLIPNSLMWWIMGLSDRYIVSFYLGLSANGLYAIATKIPSILNIIHTIFFQAWQLSAIEESNSDQKSVFYSTVFNVFSIMMLSTVSLILVNLKFIISLLLNKDYFVTWQYVPMLLIGVVFSSFSGFLGMNYIASKETKGLFKTSAYGAILNFVLNLILIPIIGINGATFSTMLSFLVIWVIRLKDTRNFVRIKINFRKIVVTFIIIGIQIVILYFQIDYEYLVQVFLFIIIIIFNSKDLNLLIKKMKFNY